MFRNSSDRGKRFIIYILPVLIAMVILAVAATTASAAVTSKEGKLPFTDIDSGAWYESGLVTSYVNGIVAGEGNTETFNPNGNVTRAMFAVMLARADGADTSTYVSVTFSDCAGGSWYIKSVEWAIKKGYMVGTGNKFSPDKPITREEIATVMMRYMKANGFSVSDTANALKGYTDTAKISSWALEGVKFSVAAGLVSSTSTSEKVFSPSVYVTRAQAVRIFSTLMTDYIYGNCNHSFVKPTCVEKGYCSICGFYNTLPNGHTCEKLSCKAGDTCKTCGKSVPADATLHVYTAANCTTPETCKVCKATRAPKLGHSFSKGVCKRCNDCPYDTIAKALVSGTSCQDTLIIDGGNEYIVKILHDADEGRVIFQLSHTYPTGDSDLLRLKLNRTLTTCYFTYSYSTKAHGKIFVANGNYTPSSYSKDYKLTFVKYTGTDANATTALKNVKILSEDLLKMANVLLGNRFGYTISDLGYTKY